MCMQITYYKAIAWKLMNRVFNKPGRLGIPIALKPPYLIQYQTAWLFPPNTTNKAPITPDTNTVFSISSFILNPPLDQ